MPTIDHLIIRAPDRREELLLARPIMEAALGQARFGRVSILLPAELVSVLEGGASGAHLIGFRSAQEEFEQLQGADALLLLEDSFGAAWRGWRAGIPARAGRSSGLRRFLLTHRVLPPRRRGRLLSIPVAHALRDVAGLFGIPAPDLSLQMYEQSGAPGGLLSGLNSRGRVLVRMPSWLGDLVMAEPALGALVEHLGEQRISIAAPAHLLPLLDGLYPDVRRIPHKGRGGEQFRDWRDHDLAILFTNSFRSAWVAKRAGIPQRAGWVRDGRGWLLTHGLRPARERGAKPFGVGQMGTGRRYLPRPYGGTCLELVSSLGVPVRHRAAQLRPGHVALREMNERLAEQGLRTGQSYLLASVGSRKDSAKGFPAASWARTLDHLAELGAERAEGVLPVVLVVGPGEEPCLHEILKLSAHPHLIPIVDPVTSLPQLLALASGARAALCTDGGPRHVIAATGTELACVAGPSDLRHTAEHLEKQVLFHEEMDCAPCQKELCTQLGEAKHACMLRIDCQAFASAALR